MAKKELKSDIYLTLKQFNSECIGLKPNRVFKHTNLSFYLLFRYYRIMRKLKQMRDNEIDAKIKELPRFVWLTNEWLLHICFLSIVSILFFFTYNYVPIFKGVGSWFYVINLFIYILLREGIPLRIVIFHGRLTEIQEIIKKNYYVKDHPRSVKTNR